MTCHLDPNLDPCRRHGSFFSLAFCTYCLLLLPVQVPQVQGRRKVSLTMMLFSWHRLGVEHTFDPQHKFVSSPLVSPSVLAGIRLVFVPSFLSYFTNLSYIGLVAYYWAAAVQTLFYARYRRYPIQRWPKPLQGLHVLLQSTITTFPFVVTVVFWALLSSASTFSTTFNSASLFFISPESVFWRSGAPIN
ncbi:hypothetical protein B0H13DRAFT_2142276 [Mycena leptocephala]|nr:hypothetical protein B0H13DRAFT_2142276 [Mycena leptocephala]